MERRLSAILAADVVGYSAMMEADEAGTVDALRASREALFEPAISKHHGRIFKLMGDGLLAEFGSVVDAVECAVSLQRGLAERNADVPEDRRITVRIGINLGEVIVEGEDRLGEGVNIAARLQGLAEPGGICVSEKVAREVERKLAFAFIPLGRHQVKNIAEPVTAFRVQIDGVAAKAAPRPVRRKAAPRRWRWAAALALVIVAAPAAWRLGRGPGEPPAAIPRLAVLPLDNMSDDPKLAYFADGLSEDIIAMLARSPDVSVIARNSSFTYRGKATDLRKVGTELGVGYVLEGSVRKEADRVRITAQLIEAASGSHVWSQRFDEAGADPFALADQVASKIIGTLAGDRGLLKRAEYGHAWGKDRADLGEYDYYLRGHDLFNQWTPSSLDEAAAIFREGIARYPDSKLLRIKLGFSHAVRVVNGWSAAPEGDVRQAAALARDAMSRPGLTPMERRLGHWLMAYVLLFEKDFSGMAREAELARQVAPYDAFMVGDLSQFWVTLMEPAKALEWADFAITLDPASASINQVFRGMALLLQDKPKEALEALNAVTIESWVTVPGLAAVAQIRLGDESGARAALQKALKITPGLTGALWRQILIYRDPAYAEREVEDSVKAGLPRA